VDLLQRFQVQSGKLNVPLQKNHSSPNLFFLHRENGDFSILMKDILSKLVYTSFAQVLTSEHIRQVLVVLGTVCNFFSYQPGPVQTCHTRYAVLVLGSRLIFGWYEASILIWY
jgi:hypothetical protein